MSLARRPKDASPPLVATWVSGFVPHHKHNARGEGSAGVGPRATRGRVRLASPGPFGSSHYSSKHLVLRLFVEELAQRVPLHVLAAGAKLLADMIKILAEKPQIVHTHSCSIRSG